ncbi:MAG: CSLREA domain-containing protein [Bacteroidota bacterium]
MRAGCLVLLLVIASVAEAQDILVTTTADEFGETPSACSLREAIEAANRGGDFGGCAWPGPAPTIRLGAETYVLTREGAREDSNATGDLDVRVPLRVEGSDFNVTVLTVSVTDRVLHVHDANVELAHLRIQRTAALLMGTALPSPTASTAEASSR